MTVEAKSQEHIKRLDEILAQTRQMGEEAKKITGIEERTKALEDAARKADESLQAISEKIRRDSFSLPGTEDKKYRDKFSFARAAMALKTGDWRGAEFEKEIHDQTFKRLSTDAQSRVMSNLTGATGGFLVPMEIAAGIYEKFTPKVIAKKLGATVVNPGGYPYQLVKETGFPTAYMVGETSSGTASDGAFGVTNLMPKQCIAITTISKQNAAMSNPSTEAFLQRRISERLGAKEDQQIFAGLGASNEVLGLLTGYTSHGIQSTAAPKTTQVDWSAINKAMSKLEEADVPIDTAAIAIHPFIKWEMYRNLRTSFANQVEDGAGGATGGAGFIAEFPFMTDKRFTEITGLGIASSTQLPITLGGSSNESWPIVGKWDEYVIAEWGGIMLESSDVATVGSNSAFAQNLIHLKASMWFDGAPARPDAFCAITGVVKA